MAGAAEPQEKNRDADSATAKAEYDEFGFLKSLSCQFCGSTKLKPAGKDDIGTQIYKCENCGRYCTRPKTKEREKLEKVLTAPTKNEAVQLQHLNLIEDPGLAGKPVVVEAVVSSTSIAYLVPSIVEAVYTDEEGFEQTVSKTIGVQDLLNLQLVSVNELAKYRRLKRFLELTRDANIKEKAYRTVYRIRVRPPVFTLEKRGEKIVDERGFEYKSFDIYVVAEKPVKFQPSSLILVEGLPVPNPKSQQTTLLAYRVEFPEEAVNFDVEKLEALKRVFEGMTPMQRLNWILDNFECYSGIVGRRNLATAGFLTYFTPTWIRFCGETQRGWGNTLIYGDTTTAKTGTLLKQNSLLKGGMLITAETASTVGLTGTATQVEREGWFIDWGFLVLCDRKLLAVDGAHKLSLANWAALAEAERSGVVNIAKAAKNSAYARTRQIKIANPVDREADKYTTKSLSGFLYPCQALPTILDKVSIARLDLAVFSDQHDVSPEEINKRRNRSHDPALENLAEVLKWCWSDSAKVEFTDEAVDSIHAHATDIYRTFFCEDIPLASIDMKWKLARLSAALAFLTLSTEDFKTVTVTKEHVEIVADFIRQEYSKAGLNILAQTERYEALTLEDVEALLTKLTAALSETVDTETLCDILRYFVIRGRATRDEIMAKFSLAENNQLRPLLAVLTSEKLIKLSRGFYAEPKLIQAYKVSGGFDLSRLSSLSTSEKEPPTFLGEKHAENTPSFSNLDKVDNLDKNSGNYQVEKINDGLIKVWKPLDTEGEKGTKEYSSSLEDFLGDDESHNHDELLKAFRQAYPQTFNNVEFYHWFVDGHGLKPNEAEGLLKRLVERGEVFSSYEGVWRWT